jgi:alpha-beta hydrolase superfamily lysophospholipase
MSDSLTKNGYALYSLDMLGHGFSEGLRWYVPDWKVNRDDLDKFSRFASAENPGVPLFLLGESYGSTTVLHLARKWQDNDNAPKEFAGIVTNAPAIVSEMPPYPVVFTLRYVLAPLFPRWVPFFMPNPVSADRIWRDEEVRGHHTDPRWMEMGLDGGGRPFRLRTAVSLTNALEEVRDTTIPGLNVPFCALHGENDVAIPIEGLDLLEEKAATPAEDRVVYRIKDAYHDLLSDPTSDENMSYIIKFLDERSQKVSESLQQ